MEGVMESFLHICTLLGVGVILLVTIGPIGYFCYQYFTSVKCPECGHRKFQTMVGGPPKCKKCGWQNTVDWRNKNPTVEIKGKWWNTNFE
jgi:hypothetical protein